MDSSQDTINTSQDFDGVNNKNAPKKVTSGEKNIQALDEP
jgi:hypothetical protein